MSFDAGVAWYLIRDCCTNDFIWLACQPLLPQHAAALGFDLTYLSIHDRETTLKNIDTILEHIREDLPRDVAWCERPEDRRRWKQRHSRSRPARPPDGSERPNGL